MLILFLLPLIRFLVFTCVGHLPSSSTGFMLNRADNVPPFHRISDGDGLDNLTDFSKLWGICRTECALSQISHVLHMHRPFFVSVVSSYFCTIRNLLSIVESIDYPADFCWPPQTIEFAFRSRCLTFHIQKSRSNVIYLFFWYHNLWISFCDYTGLFPGLLWL